MCIRDRENTVLLADGTTVHLNAGSKLLYPVRFVGKRRIVTLEGEAYFDVRKDEEHPFVVRTRFGEVTVLGTAFNINAYNDADACYTTCLLYTSYISNMMFDNSCKHQGSLNRVVTS